MGEAKAKLTRLQRLLRAQPWCVYCGGSTAAETVDHVPPITIFDGRQRPGGVLELSACAACNGGARACDQVAGMISRAYPNPGHKATRAEMVAALRGVSNNHPGLLEEMMPTPSHFQRARDAAGKLPPDAHPMNAGPLLNAAMRRFSDRMGMALHFHHTGRIVPESGVVAARWISNYQALAEGIISDDLLRLVGPPGTLRQGRLEVANQFLFASAATDDGEISVHLATFRLSFGVIAFASTKREHLDFVSDEDIIRPGFLKRPN